MKYKTSVELDLRDTEAFKERFPMCISKFLRLCIRKALYDQKFFYMIFWSDDSKQFEIKLINSP